MRIGIFTDVYPPLISGVATSVVMLKEALEKKGHQVYVVAINDSATKHVYETDNKVLRLPGMLAGIYDYRVTNIYPLWAIKQIKKWNLDVIHSQTEFGVGTFARIFAKQYNIPIVHTYHTFYEDSLDYITKGHFDKISKKIVGGLTKFYCDKTINELIVPTKKAYDLFKNKYKFDRNIYIIPTGLKVEKFYKENISLQEVEKIRNKVELNKDDFVLLFVGRIGKEKRIDYLIDAHYDLVKKYPNCKLLIIGDGPEKEKYENKVKNKNMEQNIIFTGKVPLEEIPKYYQLANIFVTASHYETQGLTVLEAMAGSIPVVAVVDESFKDVVIDGLNGFSFKNKRQYRNSILSLMNDQEKLNSMKIQARLMANNYSSERFASQVLDIYKIAMGSRYKKTLKEKIRGIFKK